MSWWGTCYNLSTDHHFILPLWMRQPFPILLRCINALSWELYSPLRKIAWVCMLIFKPLFQKSGEFLELRWWVVFVAVQELGELQEAKQLLIQQKLELQTRVEAAQGDLEQERKEHQSTKDGSLQQKEKLLAQIKDLQDKVVGLVCLTASHGYVGTDHRINTGKIRDENTSFHSWPRREPEKSRWSVARRPKPRWACRWRLWMKTWPRWRGSGRAASGESESWRSRRMNWEERSPCWRPPSRTTRMRDVHFWKGELF